MTIREMEEAIRVEMEKACRSRDVLGYTEGRRAGLAFALDLIRDYLRDHPESGKENT